jgi:hypothetical protein
MIQIRQVLYVMVFAMLFQTCSVAATPLESIPLAASERKPITKAIKVFAGNARTRYYSDPRIKDKALVSDRILDGFGYGPLRLTLPNGTAIYWGFRHGEATTESVVIYGPEGRPRLLAAVDSIPWCAGRHCEPFTSVDAYQAHAERTYLHPGIAVFVRDKRDLDTYLPYLKNWLQANLLGFNVNCKEPGMAEACKFVTQTELTQFIPIRAYLLPSMQPLALPKVPAANVPLEAFTQ